MGRYSLILSIFWIAACGGAEQDAEFLGIGGKSEEASVQEKASVDGCFIVRYVCELPDGQVERVTAGNGPYLVDKSVAEKDVFISNVYVQKTDQRICLASSTYGISLGTDTPTLEITVQQNMTHELFFQAECS